MVKYDGGRTVNIILKFPFSFTFEWGRWRARNSKKLQSYIWAIKLHAFELTRCTFWWLFNIHLWVWYYLWFCLSNIWELSVHINWLLFLDYVPTYFFKSWNETKSGIIPTIRNIHLYYIYTYFFFQCIMPNNSGINDGPKISEGPIFGYVRVPIVPECQTLYYPRNTFSNRH